MTVFGPKTLQFGFTNSVRQQEWRNEISQWLSLLPIKHRVASPNPRNSVRTCSLLAFYIHWLEIGRRKADEIIYCADREAKAGRENRHWDHFSGLWDAFRPVSTSEYPKRYGRTTTVEQWDEGKWKSIRRNSSCLFLRLYFIFFSSFCVEILGLVSLLVGLVGLVTHRFLFYFLSTFFEQRRIAKYFDSLFYPDSETRYETEVKPRWMHETHERYTDLL